MATAFAVVLWLIPGVHSALAKTLTPHDFARLAQLGVMLVMAIAWAFQPPTAPEGRPQAARWPLAVLGMLVTASCLHAAHPLIAAREVALFVGLFLLATQLARAFVDPATRDRCLDILVCGAAAYGVIWFVLLLASVTITNEQFVPWELTFGFDNARFLNHAQSIALPLCGVVLLRPAAPRWLRYAAATALITGGAILTLYVARASILGMLIAAIGTGVLFGRASFRYILTMIATLSIGAVAAGLIWHFRLQHVIAEPMPLSDGAFQAHFRDELFAQALSLFASSPWLGVGPMHFTNTVNPIAGHPHSIYLQTLAEYGLPATLLMCWLAFRFLGHALKGVRHLAATQPVLAAGLVAATIAMLVDGMFSGSWVMPISQMWIATLMALLISVSPVNVEGALPTARSLPGKAWRALVLCALIASTAMAVPEASDPVPHLHTGEPMKRPIGHLFLSFRFWSYGWF